MKRILLLGPDPRGGPPLAQRLVEQQTDEAGGDDATYSSVIVINDGSADTLRRLRAALELRQRQKQLCIGMLSYLDDAMLATEGRLPTLVQLEPQLKVALEEEATLCLEYQAL